MPTITENHKLYPAYGTGVKFYASLTRDQAKGTTPIGLDEEGNPISVEPGAVCFVSDNQGNSIFLNGVLFGDGAKTGSGGSGGGITEVILSEVVVVEKDGQVLKTLADYFSADGDLISESLNIYKTVEDSLGNPVQQSIFKVDKSGIYINETPISTYIQNEITSATPGILNSAQTLIDNALQNAKDYTDSKLSSIYTPKGSVATYAALRSIANPKSGWVYNVVAAYKPDPANNPSYVIPAGTNYAYIEVTDKNDSRYPGYWDALGGTVDLSAYKTAVATTTEINTALDVAKEYSDTKVGELKITVETNTGSINTINTNLLEINSGLATNTQNIATNTSNIEQNTTNITNISTQLTWQ